MRFDGKFPYEKLEYTKAKRVEIIYGYKAWKRGMWPCKTMLKCVMETAKILLP